MPSDHLGHLADRHALLRHRMQHRSCRGGLQSQAEHPRGVEPVHRRPAVGPVADVAGHALLACDTDHKCHEAVIAIPVAGRGQPDHGRAHATGGEGERQVGVGQAVVRTASADQRRRRVLVGPSVPLTRHAPWCEPERPGGDEERTIGVRERLAEGFDRLAIGRDGAREVPGERQVVLEREVDHAVRRIGRRAQGVEIVERAATHLRPGGGERGGRVIRAGEPDHLMPRADQFGNDRGADPAGCAGDENTHENLQVGAALDTGSVRERTMSVTAITIAKDVSHCHQLRWGG